MSNTEVIRHEIKIQEEYFRSVLEGHKNFEIRYNDRGYQRGDLINMREWDGKAYTGHRVIVRILYVSHYQQKENWCVWGFEIVSTK